MLDLIRRVAMSFNGDAGTDAAEGVASVSEVMASRKRTTIAKPFKIKKKRSPLQRLKARMYYRRNKNKINLARKRAYKKTKIFGKTRKLHKRAQPSWLKKLTQGLSSHKPSHPRKPKSLGSKLIHHLTSPGKVKTFKPKSFSKRHRLYVPKKFH